MAHRINDALSAGVGLSVPTRSDGKLWFVRSYPAIFGPVDFNQPASRRRKPAMAQKPVQTWASSGPSIQGSASGWSFGRAL